MQILKLKNVNIHLHPSFLIVLGLIFCSYLQVLKDIRITLITSFIVFFQMMFSLFVHECAHIRAANLFYKSEESSNLYFWALGGLAEINVPEDIDPKKEMMIAAAGPLSNFVLAIISIIPLVFLFNARLLFFYLPNHFWTFFFSYFACLNLFMGIFNLVPAYPMDGGRVLRAFLRMYINEERAVKISSYFAYFFSIVAIVGAFYLKAVLLGLVGLFILVSAYKEGNALRAKSISPI
jgi:Zn-dependent protease